ncbi:MAG: methyltransferase domain-containing protein [Synechococcaceae cyanobacterium]
MPPAQLIAPQLIAMHGWAGDGRSWEAWRPAVENLGWSLAAAERGYGGLAPAMPRWQGNGARVVLAHSFGPHLIAPDLLAEADLVVLLASFARFVPPGAAGRAVRTALAGMEAVLTDAGATPAQEAERAATAQAMLQRFLERAAAPEAADCLPAGPAAAPITAGGRALLRTDLQRLASTTGLPAAWPTGARVLIVEAGADTIVGPEARALLRAALPVAEVLERPGAGHALLGADLVPAVLGWLQRTLADPATPGFSRQVRRCFARHARHYGQHARLQRGLAARLAHLGQTVALPAGPRADLGAGSGLLSSALTSTWPSLGATPPLQLDLCPELLAQNPHANGANGLVWDLNAGLPPQLRHAALLTSGFALHWLDDPVTALAGWARALVPGGLLALSVPTAGSFPQWRTAAAAAAVPCTALALPDAPALLAAVAELETLHTQLLRFHRPAASPQAALRPLRRLGAGASRSAALSPGQWRRLLAHWPAPGITWEVLLLIARRS